MKTDFDAKQASQLNVGMHGYQLPHRGKEDFVIKTRRLCGGSRRSGSHKAGSLYENLVMTGDIDQFSRALCKPVLPLFDQR